METTTVVTSDTMLLKRFFFPEDKASVVSAELKKLGHAEKAALAEGIRNGTLTY